MKNSSFIKKSNLIHVASNGHIHAIVPVVALAILFLVNYPLITLIGVLIIRLRTKSWKRQSRHTIIYIIFSVLVSSGILLIFFGKNSLMEFAYIIFAGLASLLLFFILCHAVKLSRELVSKKIISGSFLSPGDYFCAESFFSFH